MTAPRRIEPVFVERVWGRTDLAPLFGKRDRPTGEVWFPLGDGFPLLVKFLFTDERLSIQVHPEDDYAREKENSRGKTEMWYILAAEPGATIALGFTKQLSTGELRAAIEDGSVVDLLEWVPVKAGDTLFAPAGVVHAIGSGVTLCEIQQNSDVTYRLYDYGRPRELHLERGLEVARTDPYQGKRSLPVECQHFVTDLLQVSGPSVSGLEGEYLLIPIGGSGRIGGDPFEAGQVWHIPSGSGAVTLEAEPRTQILRTRCTSPVT